MQNEIIQTKVIRTEFNETFTELLNLLASFNQKQFNSKPGEEKWSAGQVAGHLIKAISPPRKCSNHLSPPDSLHDD